jgi:hypothetical protein
MFVGMNIPQMSRQRRFRYVLPTIRARHSLPVVGSILFPLASPTTSLAAGTDVGVLRSELVTVDAMGPPS